MKSKSNSLGQVKRMQIAESCQRLQILQFVTRSTELSQGPQAPDPVQAEEAAAVYTQNLRHK